MTATGTSALSVAVKTAYDADYLMAAQSMMFHDGLCEIREFPNGRKGSSMQFEVSENLAPATSTLTETSDVTPVVMRGSQATVTLAEYGNAVQPTRFLGATAYVDVYNQAAQNVGYNLAESLDVIVRAIMGQGSRVIYKTSTSRAGQGTSNIITGPFVLRMVTMARGVKIPPYPDGMYVAVIHPHVHYDMLQDADLKLLSQYSDPDMLLNGEIGHWGGLRFVVSPNAKAWWQAGSGSAVTVTSSAVTTCTVGDGSTATDYQITIQSGTLTVGSYYMIGTTETANTWSDTNEYFQVISGSGTGPYTVQVYDSGPNDNMGWRYAHSGASVKTGVSNVYPITLLGPRSLTKSYAPETGPYGVTMVTGPFDVLGRFINHGWYAILGYTRTQERWMLRGEVGGTY